MRRNKIRPACCAPAFLALVALSCLFSCGVDRWPEYYPLTARDLWLDSLMREDYLWWDEIPASEELNYFLSPQEFLDDVRASADNGFSTVDTLSSVPEPIYGFDYSLSRIPDNDTAYYALVTYVIPGSPAEEAGLQRGDWIMRVDTALITLKNEAMLTEGDSRNLVVGIYAPREEDEDDDEEEEEEETLNVVEDRTLLLPAPRAVEDPVIPTYGILDGHVGYIVYNSFCAEQDAEVLRFSAWCRENGVDNLVLDLRYNAGGNMGSVQRWASILAPATALGSTLASLSYSEKQSARNCELAFDTGLAEEGGENLNLSTVYVLTSTTTGGAAEMLVNCLRPYMDVVLVGSTTVGNCYGTASYYNSSYACILNLVVCEVFNAEGTADYASGFVPDYVVDEFADFSRVLPLGDPQEALLATALSLINGEAVVAEGGEGAETLSTVRNVKVKRYFKRGLSLD